MLELPQELLGELIMHEAERTDIVGARAALESALMFQYQTIAERLLADLLLRGGAEQSIFWQHYLTKRPAHPISRADFTNPDFVLFQDPFRPGTRHRAHSGLHRTRFERSECASPRRNDEVLARRRD